MIAFIITIFLAGIATGALVMTFVIMRAERDDTD